MVFEIGKWAEAGILRRFNMSGEEAVSKVKQILQNMGYKKEWIQEDLKNGAFVYGVLGNPEIVEEFKDKDMEDISNRIIFGRLVEES